VNKELLAVEITAAMRAHDKPRLAILRQVKNEVEVKEKNEQRELSDEEVVAALKKVLKQAGETLEGSIKAGTNAERTELLQVQIAILEGYLPAQVSGAELEALVDKACAEGGFTEKKQMGQVIGAVVAATGGNCDKSEVAKLVGARLA